MELVIASERVGQWLETLACTKFKPLRRRGAVNALAKAVAESEPYREEAIQNNAVATILLALDSDDGKADAKLNESLNKCLAVCQQGAPKKVCEYTFDGHVVTIKESSLGEGVGALVWGACNLFCERLLAVAPQLVHGRQMLEVGAGCGLCGLLAARLGAERVVLTDCFAGVLRNLEECVNLNQECEPKPCETPVRYLDWGEELRDDVPETAPLVDVSGAKAEGMPSRLGHAEKFPVVMTCDCLYEPQHARMLADCHARRLSPHGCAFMLLPIRDSKLLEEFLTRARGHGLQTCVVPIEPEEWDRPGLRGSCDYEGGYNWVYLQWEHAPAAQDMGLQDLPWNAVN